MAPKGRIGPYYTGTIERERIERLTRIYHTSYYAAEATGIAAGSLTRAAKRYGLSFRRERNPSSECH